MLGVHFREVVVLKAFVAHFVGKADDNFTIGKRLSGCVESFGQVADAPLRVCHGAFLLTVPGSRQHQVCVLYGQVLSRYLLYYYELSLFQGFFGLSGIG